MVTTLQRPSSNLWFLLPSSVSHIFLSLLFDVFFSFFLLSKVTLGILLCQSTPINQPHRNTTFNTQLSYSFLLPLYYACWNMTKKLIVPPLISTWQVGLLCVVEKETLLVTGVSEIHGNQGRERDKKRERERERERLNLKKEILIFRDRLVFCGIKSQHCFRVHRWIVTKLQELCFHESKTWTLKMLPKSWVYFFFKTMVKRK